MANSSYFESILERMHSAKQSVRRAIDVSFQSTNPQNLRRQGREALAEAERLLAEAQQLASKIPTTASGRIDRIFELERQVAHLDKLLHAAAKSLRDNQNETTREGRRDVGIVETINQQTGQGVLVRPKQRFRFRMDPGANSIKKSAAVTFLVGRNGSKSKLGHAKHVKVARRPDARKPA